MNNKKIICVIADVWDNDISTLGFDIFLKNGYAVEIWKVGKLTSNRSVWVEFTHNIPTVKFEGWSQLYSQVLLQPMKKTIFLFYTYGISEFDKVQMIIKCLGGKYCTVSYSPLGSKYNHIKLKEVMNTEHHFMDRFPASFNFLGGSIHMCSLRSKHEVENGNNILLHTHDYDVYLQNEKEGKKVEENYILFFDQNLLDHKDQVNFGIKKWIPNEERYIYEINRFMDTVEKKFGKPIIIAAHPTSTNQIERIYGERTIVYGDSCNYTKYADFVIAFSSGAMSYAVLYNKPILFWNCDQLRRTSLYLEWQAVKAAKLKAKIINISDDICNIALKEYLTDINNYEGYREYIVSDKSKKKYFEVVVDYINTL